MLQDLFFELVDRFDDVEADQEKFLQEVCSQYGLSHIAYLGLNIPSVTDQGVHLVNTYEDSWCQRYLSQGYVDIDPVVSRGMGGMLPLDWQSVRSKNKKIVNFFGEAREFGVGQQGLSIPIRGAHGETALFSINSHYTDQQWDENRLLYIRDFQQLAYLFHVRILEAEGVKFDDVTLTCRETECLKWVAAGKTIWESSKIMGISEETVKFFLTNIRTKLGAINTVQAVAKATRLNLI